MATPYDAAWKLLFSFPVMPHDLLAGFVPRAWVEHLDLSKSTDRSGSLVSNGLLQRHQDVVDALIEWLHEEAAPEDLARAFWTWMGYAHVPAWRQKMAWPVLKDWREAGTMLRESVNEWTTKWMAEGQTAVMRRMAARKFGSETADRLAERLAKIADPERTGEIGEWLIECNSGEELLARVARLCETTAAEGCASQA